MARKLNLTTNTTHQTQTVKAKQLHNHREETCFNERTLQAPKEKQSSLRSITRKPNSTTDKTHKAQTVKANDYTITEGKRTSTNKQRKQQNKSKAVCKS